MGIEFGPGSLAGALGLAGVGIAMIIPDNKWIGGLFVLAAIAVLFFDVRITGWHFEAGPATSTLAKLQGLRWSFLGVAIISLFIFFGLSTLTQKPASDEKPIARLAELGWTVKSLSDSIRFEFSNGPLPPMRESASYFAQLNKPFSLQLQTVTSLDGLRYLADNQHCTSIGISAGEFTDISALSGFAHLTKLTISQTPLTSPGVVDTAALSTLTNLDELSLGMSKVRSVEFLKSLKKIKKLGLGGTLVLDLSPVSALTHLESLDIRDAPANDLSPLEKLHSLAELDVGGNQVPSLTNLAGLENLRTLRIIDQRHYNLAPVGALANLQDLWIWGATGLDIAPLRSLTKLRAFSLSGFGFGTIGVVRNIETVGEWKSLKSLALGSITVSDISFVANLSNLEQLTLSDLPISTLAPISGLSSLKKVSMIDIHIVDISPLLQLPALTDFSTIRVPARSDVIAQLQRRGVNVKSY